jgi:ketosteroid isomerase-like protein
MLSRRAMLQRRRTMKVDNASNLIRKCFSAWEAKDRETLEGLLAEDFTFTSPNDDDHSSKS